MTARRRAVALRSLLLIGLVALLAACGGTDIEERPLDALSPDGPIARAQDDLWRLVFPIAVVVFILVQGLIIFAVIRFRDRGTGEMPKQIEGNTRLEILWTVIPALILAVIAVPTVTTIFELDGEPPVDERLDVTVVGKQYWWQFEYPDEGFFTANEITVPVDTPVHLHLDGTPEYEMPDGSVQPDPEQDQLVLHSFWVPRLAGKKQYMPGSDRFLTIQADEPGRYLGNCAEFCGLSHANMRIRVNAVEPDEYEQWVAEQSQEAESFEGEDSAAARGEELFGVNCVSCHNIDGHPDNQGIRIGPDLTHFNSRPEYGGAIFDVEDDEQLADWIRNSPAEKPGSQMQPFPDLTDDEIDDLISYLRTLD